MHGGPRRHAGRPSGPHGGMQGGPRARMEALRRHAGWPYGGMHGDPKEACMETLRRHAWRHYEGYAGGGACRRDTEQ